ncbi:MAG: hypothetical protein ACLRM8_10375 [Alistipes sp.]
MAAPDVGRPAGFDPYFSGLTKMNRSREIKNQISQIGLQRITPGSRSTSRCARP